MKSLVKSLARTALGSGPGLSVLRARVARGRPITVLCYHTIGADGVDEAAWVRLALSDFADQIAYVARHWQIVSLDEAVQTGPGAGGDKAPDKPLAVITFDDGEAGLSRHLLPFLAHTPIPVTVYVATGHIEAQTPYWFDRVMSALEGTAELAIDLGGPPIRVAGSGAARWLGISDVLETIKSAEPGARDDLANRVLDQAGEGATGPDNPCPDGPLRPMTRDELAELAAHPMVTIGGHSHCHHLLDRIPLDQAAASIRTCRDLLRDWTGQAVEHFAYPNGNWNRSVAGAVADAGFHTATILGQSLWRDGADAFALPRVAVGRHDALDRVRLALAEI